MTPSATVRRSNGARVGTAGFALIEMLMVLALISLLAAMVFPKINLRGYRVNGAVRGVAGLMARAQRRAVTIQANVNVLFDVNHNAVIVHEDVNNNNVQDPGEVVRTYPVGENVAFGRGSAPDHVYDGTISFTRHQGGLPEVIFRRDGSASENGGLYLTSILNARLTDARSIELERATGRVSWFQYTGTGWVKRF